MHIERTGIVKHVQCEKTNAHLGHPMGETYVEGKRWCPGIQPVKPAELARRAEAAEAKLAAVKADLASLADRIKDFDNGQCEGSYFADEIKGIIDAHW